MLVAYHAERKGAGSVAATVKFSSMGLQMRDRGCRNVFQLAQGPMASDCCFLSCAQRTSSHTRSWSNSPIFKVQAELGV